MEERKQTPSYYAVTQRMWTVVIGIISFNIWIQHRCGVDGMNEKEDGENEDGSCEVDHVGGLVLRENPADCVSNELVEGTAEERG